MQAWLVKAAHAAKLSAFFIMAVSSRSEIRDSTKSRVLGTLIGWVMRFWCRTLRYEVVDRAGFWGGAKAGPFLFAVWHNRIFALPYIWWQRFGDQRPMAVLTSASNDGAALSHAMRVFHMSAIRGSTSRRAVAALVGMKRVLLEGADVTVTPDGPRGPRYQLQGGLLKTAQATKTKIVPVFVTFSDAWRLRKTWDRFAIPKPFSRVRLIFDQALAIDPRLSEDGFEAERLRIETMMREGNVD